MSEFWRCAQCGTPNPVSPPLARCMGCGSPRTVATRPTSAPAAPVVSTVKRSAAPKLVKSATWLTGGYAVFVLIALAMIRWLGDRWWPATLLLFMPKWVYALPLPVLAGLAFAARRPALWVVQAATALVVLGPLMLFNFPTGRLSGTDSADGQRVRVMTLNLGARPIDPGEIVRLIEAEKIDLVAFQEARDTPQRSKALAEAGFHLAADGMIASRWPIRDGDLIGLKQDTDRLQDLRAVQTHRVLIDAPGGLELEFAGVHMPSIRHGVNQLLGGSPGAFQGFIDYRESQMTRLLVDLLEKPGRPMIVAGDFNTPTESPLLDRLRAAFRFAYDESAWGYGYTYAMPLPGTRIDHALATPDCKVSWCQLGPNVGSDHLPLIAEFIVPAAARAPKTENPAPPPEEPADRGAELGTRPEATQESR